MNDPVTPPRSTAPTRKGHQRLPGATAPSPPPEKKYVRLQIGDLMASAEPVILQTLLGSCVAVCLHDPGSSIGGMNHILLPGSCADSPGARFGEQAMERLIHQLISLGADQRALVAKAFGGANVLPFFQAPTVGDENAKFVRQFLATRKIPLIAQRLGGDHAVQLNFSTDSGKVSVRTVDGSRLQAISKGEESYVHSFDQRSSDV